MRLDATRYQNHDGSYSPHPIPRVDYDHTAPLPCLPNKVLIDLLFCKPPAPVIIPLEPPADLRSINAKRVHVAAALRVDMLMALRDRGEMTAAELAIMFEQKRSCIGRHLTTLKDSGLVQQVSAARYCKWRAA